MAITENEMQADERATQSQIAEFELPASEESQEAGEVEPRYPPGIKLFGEEKRRRDREIADEVVKHVDPDTGRLPAAVAQKVYHDIGRIFGLSASGIILRTPAQIKPTNQETLEYARSQKGKTPPEERAARSRRRRASGRDVAPTDEERPKRRDATVQQRVRDAAMEFVNPDTGRIPAARATEVYNLLAERFQRTPGTVSNYLKGLTPTARECAELRWERQRERERGEGGFTPAPRPAREREGGEPDYTAHPAALFPSARPPQAPPRRKPGDDPLPMKERVKTMMGPDGRLIDYDESFQMQRLGETVETKLDEATADFLRSFRVQQASEFIDALKDCGRQMTHYTLATQRFLQEFHQGLKVVGDRIWEVAGASMQELRQRHVREIEELKEYIEALEEDNNRLNTQLSRARAILDAPEDDASSGVAVTRSALGRSESRND